MKRDKKFVALSALAVACAPVVAEATVLFQDNFDTDTSARYDQFIFDRASTNDASATFNFNYGAFTYYHVSADESNQNEADPIPQAPRTTGGTSIGLRMDVNQIDSSPTSADNPDTVVINLYPKLSEYLGSALPSGDHKMTVDVWLNYNGRFEGGGGSTEHAAFGINASGGGVSAGAPVTPPGGPFSGLGFTVNGERGNSFDYRFWNGTTRIGGTDGLGAEVGYVAVDEGAGNPGPGDGLNSFYQSAFPFLNPNDANDQWYETPGGIGKHWNTLEMVYEDGIVYTYLKPAGSTNPPILIGARTEEETSSGHAMLGYADLNNNAAALEPSGGNHDANFVIYDNLVVETVTQTRQKWNHSGGGAWSEAGKWDNGIADNVTHVADFTTALPSPSVVNVDGPRTVRSITFDSANGYTLSGSTITIDSLTPGIRGKIKAVTGSHTISATLHTEKPLTFDIAAGAQVKVDNLTMDIDVPAGHTEAPNAILKKGAGVAEVNRVVLADEDGLASTVPSMTVNAGTLKITPNSLASGVSNVPALNITGTGKLDITNNKLVTASAIGSWNGTTYTGVTGLIKQGRGTSFNPGNPALDPHWDGASGIITSQSDATLDTLHSIGVAKGSDVLASPANPLNPLGATETTTWAGQTVNGNSTLVMYSWGGDVDLDGDLDGDDYFVLDSNIGQSGTVFGFAKGDVDYDGDIDGDDYFMLDGNIGFAQTQPPFFTAGGAGLTAVPEPGALGLLGVAALGFVRRRRRI